MTMLTLLQSGTSIPRASELGPFTVVSTTPPVNAFIPRERAPQSGPLLCDSRRKQSQHPNQPTPSRSGLPVPLLRQLGAGPRGTRPLHAAHRTDPGIYAPRSRSSTERDRICARGAPQARRGRVILENPSGKKSTAHSPLPSPELPGAAPHPALSWGVCLPGGGKQDAECGLNSACCGHKLFGLKASSPFLLPQRKPLCPPHTSPPTAAPSAHE